MIIRSLTSDADYQACLALQYETWGRGFREAVPPSILLVSRKLGGVAAGAFDDAGRMLGFVFGMTGVRDGVVVHWSDMLAVRADAQNAGIGRALKAFQREEAGKAGARVMLWTFDPLMARNAHLNFNILGARGIEYVPDMYGHSTGSDLHRGIGTDRLVVEWPLDDGALAEQRALAARAGDVAERRIEIPGDFAAILRDDPAEAVRWRETTRAQFTAALADGYRVRGFKRPASAPVGHYLLAR